MRGRGPSKVYGCLLGVWAFYVVSTTLLFSGPPSYPPRCWCSGENFCLPPLMPLHPVLQSRFFSCALLAHVRDFRLQDSEVWANLEDLRLNADLEIVTAASSNHFNLSRGLLRHLRLVHPENRVVFYDLGLSLEERSEVQQLCNVEYRRFPFERFPPHVRDLMNFSWKVVILAEELKLNRTFMYLDASVRFTPFYQLDRVLELVRQWQIEPYTALRNVHHSIYATTTPGFYKYVPLPKTISQTYRVDSAAAQLVVPVEYTRQVMKWKVLCALTPECIAPSGHAVECVFKSKDTYTTYHGCHRYDQSLFSALTARNLFGPEHWAHRFNYSLDPGSSLNDVLGVLEVRKARYYQVARMLRLDRDDQVDRPLKQKCTLEQELLKAWR